VQHFKKPWTKPSITRFASADEVRLHFDNRGSDQQRAALVRMLDRCESIAEELTDRRFRGRRRA
jgi:hypothetical protein